MEEKEFPQFYLGDGVYVKFSNDGLWLYTSNGITTTNSIYLEPEVFNRLIEFQKIFMEWRKIKSNGKTTI